MAMANGELDCRLKWMIWSMEHVMCLYSGALLLWRSAVQILNVCNGATFLFVNGSSTQEMDAALPHVTSGRAVKYIYWFAVFF